jgi:hypothetical protein
MSNSIESLTDLLAKASSRRFLEAEPYEDFGISEQIAFPFLALVGQQ